MATNGNRHVVTFGLTRHHLVSCEIIFKFNREATKCSWDLILVKERPLDEKVMRAYIKLVKCEHKAVWITNSRYQLGIYSGELFDEPVRVNVGESARSKVSWTVEELEDMLLAPPGGLDAHFSFDAKHGSLKSLADVLKKDNAQAETTLQKVLREYKAQQGTSLIKVMNSVLNDAAASDVTLVAESQSFSAHKCVLRGRSAVFAAMFDSGMKESLTGEVTIVGFQADIVKAMLEYIYTGKIAAAVKHPFEVLKIADQYQLLELRDTCEKIILSTLSVTNAAEALVLADQLKLNMKSGIMAFVNRCKYGVSDCRNRLGFTGTESYRQLAQQHPHLVVELYEYDYFGLCVHVGSL